MLLHAHCSHIMRVVLARSVAAWERADRHGEVHADLVLAAACSCTTTVVSPFELSTTGHTVAMRAGVGLSMERTRSNACRPTGEREDASVNLCSTVRSPTLT